MAKSWKTFICYRKGEDSTVEPYKYSKLFADVLFQHIQDDKFFKPVLYLECNHDALLSYDDDDSIKNYMKDVHYFIPIITPDFFNTIVDGSDKIYTQPFSKETFKELQTSYKEMAYGIYNRAFILPIYLSDSNNKTFFMNKKQQNNVEEMLFRAVEFVSSQEPKRDDESIDYKKFIHYFMTRTSPLVVPISDVDKMINNDDKQSKELIEQYMKRFDEIDFPIDKFMENLLQDLAKIHHVIQCNGYQLSYENNIMDADAYERFELANNPECYCISSAFIHGVPYLKDNHIVNNEPLPEGAGRGFIDVKNDCYITSEEKKDKDYFYWPLNLSTNRKLANNPKFFNVCAISFGAMMLNNWYLYDEELYKDIKIGSSLKNRNRKQVRAEIDQSINLLLSLRDYYNMSWLSKWEFGPKLGAAAGTINQTTLSISTLITCGFLDRMDYGEEKEEDNSKLYNRIRFIDSSLVWLEDMEKRSSLVQGAEAYYWGDGYNDKINISLSLFCLDVYMKYYEKIIAATKLDDTVSPPKMRGMTYSTYCDDIKNNINGIIRGLCAEIPEYIKSDDISKYDKLLIYSKVLKSFCAYLLLEMKNGSIPEEITENPRDPVVYKQVVALSKEALKYLYDNKELMMQFNSKNCECHLLIEKFPYITAKKEPDDYDYYDNCAELLFIDAMIKAADLKLYNIANIQNVDLFDSIKSSIQWFQDNMISNEDAEFICIKGHNALSAPIYAYYYYRMVIYDYIRLMEKDEQ